MEWITIANNVPDGFMAKYDRKNVPVCQFGHRSRSSQIIAHDAMCFWREWTTLRGSFYPSQWTINQFNQYFQRFGTIDHRSINVILPMTSRIWSWWTLMAAMCFSHGPGYVEVVFRLGKVQFTKFTTVLTLEQHLSIAQCRYKPTLLSIIE